VEWDSLHIAFTPPAQRLSHQSISLTSGVMGTSERQMLWRPQGTNQSQPLGARMAPRLGPKFSWLALLLELGWVGQHLGSHPKMSAILAFTFSIRAKMLMRRLQCHKKFAKQTHANSKLC
jgi:hypothetical protein